MNNKAFYNLTYGVFLLATKAEEKANACIVNTGVQVAGSPVRVAVSVLNTNYTCALIKESGRFTLSALDDSCSFETIKHFGMQSGRDVDKLDSLPMPTDESGVPYLNWSTCARFSGKVTHSVDLGTHTLFIAEVTEAEVCSDRAPLTYADYQNKLKPKSEKVEREQKIVGWRAKFAGMCMRAARCRRTTHVRCAGTERMILSRFMKSKGKRNGLHAVPFCMSY